MALRCYVYKEKNTKYFPSFNLMDFCIAVVSSGLIVFSFFSFLHIPDSFISPISAQAETKKPITLETSTPTIIFLTPTLGPTITPTSEPTLIPTIEPTVIPTIEPTTNLTKSSYTIAIFGDSMEDTMGDNLEYLSQSLKNKYPQTSFHFYNYGIGAENVEAGIARLSQELHYQSRNYPSLTSLKPDILIIGSFAYNPFAPYDRDRHWLKLSELVQNAKNISAKVYILAEIAPLRSNFGQGPNGVNWPADVAYTHSGHIIEQLENAVGLSRSLNVPLINAFYPSRDTTGYVNPSDGIHPSVSGHQFTADIITQTIQLD